VRQRSKVRKAFYLGDRDNTAPGILVFITLTLVGNVIPVPNLNCSRTTYILYVNCLCLYVPGESTLNA
jgi:hypothetical protein